MNSFSATTILMVRRDGKTCMASDGQVTFNNTVIKATANKVKRAGKGQVLVGFAGGAADGLALYSRFESKLEEFQGNLERAVVELAKDWRTDRVLRQLQAQMIVADAQKSFFVSGNGDLMQPD
jgi:ATP-dependent HslUV protease subunit HslV